ncbi:MAG: toll/interleukin-1 receptor domain-containing protein [Candidatus Bathyarchaeota archaeon]|nr:toll/interleukin-1 receptor domain-containing protein [Candidatus Bathyarchaeota archaeon]
MHNAIKETKNKINEYFELKQSITTGIVQQALEKKRRELINGLNYVESTYFQTEKWSFHRIRKRELDTVLEIIGGSLKVHKLLLEEELKQHGPLSDVENYIKDIENLLSGKDYSFNEQNLDVYTDYLSLKKSPQNSNLIFMSYANKDKKDVGKLCDILEEKYNYRVFRAHDTIDIGEEWKDEIIQRLDECIGLVAWVTKNFRMRAWPHQECGYAIAKNVPIYPILMMKKIPGILEYIQGLPVSTPLDFDLIAEEINKTFS